MIYLIPCKKFRKCYKVFLTQKKRKKERKRKRTVYGRDPWPRKLKKKIKKEFL
jgi:hypothetical protein